MTKFQVNFLVINTLSAIGGARSYLDEMEQAIPTAELREREHLKRMAHDESWDWEDYDLRRQEIEGFYLYSMPELLTYSFITYLHSIVEVHLMILARRIRKDRRLDLRVAEIAGSQIDKSRIYLTKVAGIDVTNDQTWASLRDMAKLRNIIVHRRGSLRGDDNVREEIQRMSNKFSGELSLSGEPTNPRSRIIISTGLCRIFLDEIEGFFTRLYAKCGFKSVGLPN